MILSLTLTVTPLPPPPPPPPPHRVCTDRATGECYAVKIVSQRHRPTREVSILQMCQGHPNIVRLHEVLSDKVGGVGGGCYGDTVQE